MENKFLKEEMLISKTKHLVYYSWRWKENNSFLPDYFQVPSKVPPICKRPNVNNDFFYTSVKELFQPLLQFMVFSTRFSSKKIPKSDKCQENHPINLDKLFCKCLTQLGNQIGPCHLIGGVNNKMTNYLTNG